MVESEFIALIYDLSWLQKCTLYLICITSLPSLRPKIFVYDIRISAKVWTLGDWLYNLETSLPLCIFRAANHNTALNHVHQFKLAGKTISHCKTWTWPASKDVIGYGNNYFYIYQETSYSHRMCLVLNMQYVFDLKSFKEAVCCVGPVPAQWKLLHLNSVACTAFNRVRSVCSMEATAAFTTSDHWTAV